MISSLPCPGTSILFLFSSLPTFFSEADPSAFLRQPRSLCIKSGSFSSSQSVAIKNECEILRRSCNAVTLRLPAVLLRMLPRQILGRSNVISATLALLVILGWLAYGRGQHSSTYVRVLGVSQTFETIRKRPGHTAWLEPGKWATVGRLIDMTYLTEHHRCPRDAPEGQKATV